MDRNSKIAKVVKGSIITPSKEERRKLIITNPSDEMLKYTRGYKDTDWGNQPKYDENTQYLKQKINEIDNLIKVEWIVENIPQNVEIIYDTEE